MGTVVSLRIGSGRIGPERARSAVSAACELLHHVDDVFSTWRPESPLSRLRRGETSIDEVPAEVADALALCQQAKAQSSGWFDPWAMRGGVDPTGLVKGWALERAMDVMRCVGVEDALINGGGDLLAAGEPGPGQWWRVGIRHPWRTDALACTVRLDAAVATSGSYERGAHLIDPFTRRPATRAASATVTGPSLALADALATALAVGSDDALVAVDGLDGYEGYLIRSDGSEASTRGMAFLE